MSQAFIAKNRARAVAFLSAVIEGWAYFALHTEEVDRWYIEDAKLAYSPHVLASAARVEPNYTATNIGEIDLMLTKEHVATLDRGLSTAALPKPRLTCEGPPIPNFSPGRLTRQKKNTDG